MNKNKLKKEGKAWVDEKIITEEQLASILNRYGKTSTSNIFISFAVLFISIGILLFVFSDWATVSPIIRITLLLVVMLALYSYGYSLYQKNQQNYGISFIILGYIFFGATLFFLDYAYQAPLFIVYALPIWALLGLGLIFLFRHPALLSVGLLVTISSQGVLTMSFQQFSWVLCFVFLLGYFHFVFHRPSKWPNILFSLGLIVHTLYIAYSFDLGYYWLLTMYFLLYVMTFYIPKKSLHHIVLFMAIVASFIVRSSETLILPDIADYESINSLFWSFWILVFVLFIATIIGKKKHNQWINLVIFIPFVFLDNPLFIIIISMFIVSLYWVISSYHHLRTEYIPLSLTIFLISTFTAYIQFGWNTMNRSLFFIIGGIILFAISIFFESQRRKIEAEGK